MWHCDRDGRYSLYSPGAADQNYLRGVEEADASGAMSFTTIFPGCYAGRWPHSHFEVYASLADATGGGATLATSQLAIPEEACNQAYDAVGCAQSVTNLMPLTLESDQASPTGPPCSWPLRPATPTTASPCACPWSYSRPGRRTCTL